MDRRALVAIAPAAWLAGCAALRAGGAEVQVYVAGAAKAAYDRVAPEYERRSGDRLVPTFDTVGALRDRVTGGARPDLVLISSAAVDALQKAGLASAEGRRVLGIVTAGLAVKRGAPVPDISNVEALKRSLLAAKSIAYADPARGATSGAHFAKTLDALGLRDTLRERITVLPFGIDVIHGVAEGRFEIGASQSSEIVPNPTVTFAGALPPPHQLATAYEAAVIGGSARGAALLRYLGEDAVRPQLVAAGFNPPR
jgi:molybdate transport system substrate-binding protein